MSVINQDPFFLKLLVGSKLPFRIFRYGLLWSMTLGLIYRGFHFLATTIPEGTDRVVFFYSAFSTLVFGGLTIAAFWAIINLTHHYILKKFQFGYFILGLFMVHLIASELVLAHFKVFYSFIPLKNLPKFYSTYETSMQVLPFWKAPFDATIVWLFSFSLFYNYLIYAVSFKVFKDLFSLQHEKTELEKENLRLEFGFLKAQINPHFLFNTLNNLHSFSVRSPEKVSEPILRLAELMRYTLYETSGELVLLKKELDFLTSYIDLQRIRYDDHVLIQFSVTGQAGGLQIPPFLLIIFVENAFKHGIQSTAKASNASINLVILPKSIRFSVTNSIPAKRTDTPPGIGLSNIRKRLAYLYPGKHTLTITEGPEAFTVLLTLDLQ